MKKGEDPKRIELTNRQFSLINPKVVKCGIRLEVVNEQISDIESLKNKYPEGYIDNAFNKAVNDLRSKVKKVLQSQFYLAQCPYNPKAPYLHSLNNERRILSMTYLKDVILAFSDYTNGFIDIWVRGLQNSLQTFGLMISTQTIAGYARTENTTGLFFLLDTLWLGSNIRA